MISEATSWLEIVRIMDKISYKILHILDKEWLYRYSYSEIAVYNNDTKIHRRISRTFLFLYSV